MFKLDKVSAHCDVPCGIYDPHRAMLAALSIIRMIDLLNAKYEIKLEHDAQFQNDVSRYIATKEEEASLLKEEIRIIWGDFIKPPHLVEHPEIHHIVHNIMMLAGSVKQHVSREKALELLHEVNKFSVIFWKIKGFATVKIVAATPVNEEIIAPVFNV